MVIRPLVSGAAAVAAPRSRSYLTWLVVAGATLGLLPAQQPGATPAPTPPAATPPAATPENAPANPAAVTPATPAAATPTFGKIVADKVPLRCWSGAVAQPPVFEESLLKDQVVAVGRSENGFRAVLLPLGPIGYVSKKLTETSPEGVVKTKGTKVSFRYRPRSSEAPVQQLDEGTTLHVVGEQDDWFQVRVPGVEAFVAEAEISVGDQTDPALAKSWAELQAKHEAGIKARLDAIAAQRAREAQDAVDLAAVQLVQDAFAAELKKDIGEQKFAPLNETLDKLVATMAAESAGRPAIAALKKRIETQNWIVEASAVRDSKPPIQPVPAPDKKDPLESFQSIGWLRYERRLAGPGVYYLEKGGQQLHMLSCNTGRYDLALFVDHEVAVNGPRRRPVNVSLSVLDIERLEVLGAPIK